MISTGGYNSNNIQLGTTEIYRGATGAFEAGPDLPGGLLLDEHCMVRVDEDRFAILGELDEVFVCSEKFVLT